MKNKYILCFSGGKDSTALLIHILKNDLPLDEILYVDMGQWMWSYAETHLKKIEGKYGVMITRIDVWDEISKGFERWGFPSFVRRWCTGIKRESMKKYIQEKYPEDHIIQYIGYCADEEKRTSKKLYSSFDTSYPLVDAGISSNEALNMCIKEGFDFEGNYEHHSHFNCWMCPLQKISELEWVYLNKPYLWCKLNMMQKKTDGKFYKHKNIFELEQQFWEKQRPLLEKKRLEAKEKYNKKQRK